MVKHRLLSGHAMSREIKDLDAHVQPARSKRAAATNDEPVSPPSKKAKTRVAATASKDAAKAFFTPISQKGSEKVTWRIVQNSLLVGRYKVEKASSGDTVARKRRKVAAFDFDSTLITTSSGNVFGRSPSDWKWWNVIVPSKLRDLYEQGYQLAIISNQGGLSVAGKEKNSGKAKRLADFKTKCNAIFTTLGLPVSLYAATCKDVYRKPRLGMWQELLDEYDLDVKDEDGSEGIDLKESFFVGDAAGRLARGSTKADHSSGDRDFAENVGVSFYTPEKFFLNDETDVDWKRSFNPLDYVDQMIQAQVAIPDTKSDRKETTNEPHPFAKKYSLEIVIFVGSPGSGKSTFYQTHMEPLGYMRVNQDTLKTRDKCIRFAREHIAEKKPVAVDNTNADRKTRAEWINLARELKVPIRCVWLQAPPELCKHNEAIRYLNAGTIWNPEDRQSLPTAAFGGYTSRFQEPKEDEGFDELIKVEFTFEGTEEMKKVWTNFWT